VLAVANASFRKTLAPLPADIQEVRDRRLRLLLGLCPWRSGGFARSAPAEREADEPRHRAGDVRPRSARRVAPRSMTRRAGNVTSRASQKNSAVWVKKSPESY
jgi:hypothetical protein